MVSTEKLKEAIKKMRRPADLTELSELIEERHRELEIAAIKKTSNVVFNFPSTHSLSRNNGDSTKIIRIKGNSCHVELNGHEYWIQRKHLKEVPLKPEIVEE